VEQYLLVAVGIGEEQGYRWRWSRTSSWRCRATTTDCRPPTPGTWHRSLPLVATSFPPSYDRRGPTILLRVPQHSGFLEIRNSGFFTIHNQTRYHNYWSYRSGLVVVSSPDSVVIRLGRPVTRWLLAVEMGFSKNNPVCDLNQGFSKLKVCVAVAEAPSTPLRQFLLGTRTGV
jgi:hypothetical protein